MEKYAAIACNGWYGMHIPLSQETEVEGLLDALHVIPTTAPGDERPEETTLRQQTADVETVGSGPSRRLKFIICTTPCSLRAGSAEAATASPGTAGCEAQCLLAYRALLGQMEDSPTRLKIARKVEQLAETAMEGSWQKGLKDKWQTARNSCGF